MFVHLVFSLHQITQKARLQVVDICKNSKNVIYNGYFRKEITVNCAVKYSMFSKGFEIFGKEKYIQPFII